jgi:hypothetical protein
MAPMKITATGTHLSSQGAVGASQVYFGEGMYLKRGTQVVVTCIPTRQRASPQDSVIMQEHFRKCSVLVAMYL